MPVLTDETIARIRADYPAARVATPEDTKRMLRISTTTLYKLLKDGTLESVKIGRCRRIKIESIERLAANGAL